MEASQRYYTSGQSSRKRDRSEVHDQLDVEDIDIIQQEAKRRRKSEPERIYAAFTYAGVKVWNWLKGSKTYFFGSPTPPKMTAKKETTKRSDLNIGLGDDDDDDDVRIVHESKNKTKKSSKDHHRNSQEDEIQVVEEVTVHSPDMANIRFQPQGHSTIIQSAYKPSTSNPLFISTREKIHHDRHERSKPVSILQKIRENKITARRTFELSPSNWRTPYAGISKESVAIQRINRTSSPGRRFSPGTPSRRKMEGRLASVRHEDLDMYRNVLANPNFSWGNSSNKSQFVRSPMFQRDETPAIQRSYMKSGSSKLSIFQQLEKYQKKKPTGTSPELVTIDDPIIHRPQVSDSKEDRDVIEIVNIVSPPGSPKSPKKQAAMKSPVNTLAKDLEVLEVTKPDFLAKLRQKYDTRKQDREVLILEGKTKAEYAQEHAARLEKHVEDRMRKHLAITEVAIEEPEVDESEEEEEEAALPDLTDEMEGKINQYLSAAPSQKLVDAHNIPITRKDLDTLRGLNWLNDEIINFYLQMIVERNKNADKEKYPNIPDNWAKVYAMNTFFLPKLRTTGYAAIKRWTRKVDIFSFDKILVPVHLDVHWCLAVIDLKKKGVYFYDSMGSDKTDILKKLLEYLKQEHMDKKKSEFDTSGFKLQNVKDIPRQMNGSDCGMFTLKYAEYLSRNASITFTQEDMPYFRRRIVYEIVNNKVIHP